MCREQSTAFSGLDIAVWFVVVVVFGGVTMGGLLGVKWDKRLPPRVASS